MENSPYDPPAPLASIASTSSHLSPPASSPKVWPWYLAYCGCMALLYLLCLIGGIFLFAYSEWLAADSDEQPFMYVIQGLVFAVIGGVLLLLYAAVPLLPRKKWAWYYGFLTIGIGMTSICCVPFSLPLLLFWIKDETRQFFSATAQ